MVDTLPRDVVRVTDRPGANLTTYDSSSNNTSFPPSARLRPPLGAPNRRVTLLGEIRVVALSALGGPTLRSR